MHKQRLRKFDQVYYERNTFAERYSTSLCCRLVMMVIISTYDQLLEAVYVMIIAMTESRSYRPVDGALLLNSCSSLDSLSNLRSQCLSSSPPLSMSGSELQRSPGRTMAAVVIVGSASSANSLSKPLSCESELKRLWSTRGGAAPAGRRRLPLIVGGHSGSNGTSAAAGTCR